MSDEAYFFLRILIVGGLISWAILRYWMPLPGPQPDEEPEDEHLHI